MGTVNAGSGNGDVTSGMPATEGDSMTSSKVAAPGICAVMVSVVYGLPKLSSTAVSTAQIRIEQIELQVCRCGAGIERIGQ